MRELLDEGTVTAGMAGLPEWTGDITALRRSVTLASFAEAVRLIDAVAEVAEELDHHPDIDLRFRTLTFVCSTHSTGGLTALDLALAERIDALVEAADPVARGG